LPLRGAASGLLHLAGLSSSRAGRRIPEEPGIWKGTVLVVGGHAGVDAGPEHFRWFSCLAKNPLVISPSWRPFGGHFGMLLLHGRILSLIRPCRFSIPKPHPRVR
jgi:hypothetical protein